jgi:NhaP-type Na+/H+ or K+/H+ antiporter
MNTRLLIEIATVLSLGIGAQWVAWRLNLPSILLLLVLGIVAGPVAGIVDADRLLGDLLIPAVSVSVGLILFEGGLSLNLRSIGGVTGVVRRLITVGVLVTFVVLAVAAWSILGMPPSLALLFSAVLSVTGPTVIGPLLRQVRPRGQVGPILQWEGILIDPVGAALAVLVFEAIVAGDFITATSQAIGRFVLIIIVGGATGVFGSEALLLLMRRYLVPDFLRPAITLAIVTGVFVLSDIIVPESGLLAVTLMGVLLANQRRVPLHDIVEFKENIRVLILGTLFILLASRLELADLASLDARAIGFLAVLVLVARPLSVWLATIRSTLSLRERLFVMGVAPRGIVAAAVSSIFALDLESHGMPGADLLVPYTFAAIIATVAIYGLGARPLSRLLGIGAPVATGVLVVGAHEWARAIAREIQSAGIAVLLVDTNWRNVVAARADGLTTHFGSVLEEEAESELDMSGLGLLLALTANDEVNALACAQFRHAFGRGNVYRVRTRELRKAAEGADGERRGRLLFGDGLTFEEIERRLDEDAAVAVLPLDSPERVLALDEGRIAPLAIVRRGRLLPVTTTPDSTPAAGDIVIGLRAS